MVIVEKWLHFQQFLEEYNSSDWSFLHFVGTKNKHPLNDYPLMLYIRTSKGNEFIFPFNHDEADSLTLDSLLHLQNKKPKYVFFDKKNKKLIKDIFLKDYLDLLPVLNYQKQVIDIIKIYNYIQHISC